ncbi:MAG TPA: nucleoside triphosphate pyrophosphatase [Solirubrobacterales bacterium]|nr:nucleoside triphosphate pyrophosphatase [Solirubrobacterales bacterium]
MKVTLASGSPQRAEILRKLGVEFEVVVPGVDELTGGDPEFEVVENARRKAHAVGRRVLSEGEGPLAVWDDRTTPHPPPPAGATIACDTDVVLDGKALGKPADGREAREYLDRLSGRAHLVMSGLVVLADGRELTGLESTTVVFKTLTDAEKERYVAFGEWRGRSGGYAIQTLGSTLVERVEGSVANVVGLPVGLLVDLVPELLA